MIPVVFASATKRVELPGGGFGVIQKGSHWPADDPIVAAHPEVFTTDPRYGMHYSREPAGYDAPVEQATAAPGERRMTRRPPPDDTSDEAEALRAELTRLGRQVDARWGVNRLRAELEKVASAS
jgi:hypothetical protein